jgi:3-methyladenine DNA glycosylase AlkD
VAKSWTSERLRVLERSFESAGDRKRAKDMARYMKMHFAFFGVQAAARRALQRKAFAGAPRPTEAELVQLTTACWHKQQREFQYFGTDYVRQHVGSCSEEFLGHLKLLITTKSWWDTVDALATHGVGGLARLYPSVGEEMNAWIDSKNIWLARAALLYQLSFKAETNAEQLLELCRRRMSDEEFFIRKAIGWALREHSKTDPRAVRNFVRKHDAELSSLSKREALKWLDRG